MASEPQILYLEPDDEITSVVRRLRQADASHVVLVAPARTKATSSAVALRLLSAVAAEEGRSVTLVADPLARTLAGEAGIPAFASVAEATAGASRPGSPAPAAATRASIHVVRVDEPERAPAPPRPRWGDGSGPSDETRAVPVVRTTPTANVPRAPRSGNAGTRRPRPRTTGVRRRPSVVGIAVLVIVLLAVGAAAAAVLPAASVRIRPATRAIGPVAYQLAIAEPTRDAGQLPLTMTGKATGDHVERLAAAGTVTFENWNYRAVVVPAGTQVAAGEVVFATGADLSVPAGKLTGRGTIQAGQGDASVAAVEPGPAGNVAAGAINRIVDRRTANDLRGFPSNLPLVHNDAPTAGGAENHAPQVQQADVDALSKQIADALRQQLASHLAEAQTTLVLGPPGGDEQPVVNVPQDLVGKVGAETFELSGSLSYQRLGVPREQVVAQAGQRLLNDPAQTPAGANILPDSVAVEVGKVTSDGATLQVAVKVRASAAPELDPDAIRKRIANLTPDEAQAALADIGPSAVNLWPGWVGRVPTLDWRISIETDAVPASSLQPSGSPGA